MELFPLFVFRRNGGIESHPRVEPHVHPSKDFSEHTGHASNHVSANHYGVTMSLISSLVSTPSASVQGLQREDGAHEFRGLRFAVAERFERPVDVALSGNIDASVYGSICPQVPGFLEQSLGLDSSSMSEDCLFLNVYVPAGATTESQLPVLFWIHGGAYTNGSGSLDWYHGSSLATRGAIVVTINYRLGIFGFIGSENLGTEDMVSALRWTNKNIEFFGGNPNNVTIFGESAGGSAVVSLMASSDAEPLFHKAWAMSPSIGQLRSAERSAEIQQTIFDEAQVASVSALADKTVDELLELQNSLLTRPSREFDWFAPSAGCNSVSSTLLATAAASSKPFVIGTNRDENKLWSAFNPASSETTVEAWTQHTAKIFGEKASEAQTVYETRRAGESHHFLISAVDTDVAFRARAWALVNDRCDEEMPTWMYWFTWPTPAFGGILGSCHALDIPFAFDNLDAPGGEMFTGDSPERLPIAQRFADEITSFATHGHPSWEQYNTQTRPTLQIDTAVTLVLDPEHDIRQLFTIG